MCRHKRLFLLQGERREDSGAPDRQRGTAALRGRHSAPAAGSKTRGLPRGAGGGEDAEGWTVSRPAHGAPRPGRTEAGSPGEEATGRCGG